MVGESHAAGAFVFQAPHHLRSPAAVLAPTFGAAVDGRAKAAGLADPTALLAFALHETTGALHFGLSHRTHLSFDGKDREGNCVEYAELFASIVNREHGAVPARAWVVRSDASILGMTIKDPAWRDHDWVLLLVSDGRDRMKRYFVDPSLADMGLGWNIEGEVQGVVKVP